MQVDDVDRYGSSDIVMTSVTKKKMDSASLIFFYI